MNDFLALLRRNRNYRFTWSGQIVSEVGDHFNNIAVFSLALANTGSGLVVALILIARAIPAVMAGPIAGVLLDRWDRKRIMIASDLARAVIALVFIFAIPHGRTWLLYILSGALMFASPFFTSGRASILPSIATKDELHTANSLTQLTQWTTVTIGSFLGGASVRRSAIRWRSCSTPLRSCFPRGASRTCASKKDSARSGQTWPRIKSCARGTNTWKACATCERRR